MVNKLRKRKVDTSSEKRILTGLIVSTRFIQEVIPLLRLEYFQNAFVRTVTEWVLDFYESYEVAPFDHIQDIFASRQDELKEGDSDLFKKLLTNISKKYELDKGLNIDYIRDQTVAFFKKRELEIRKNNIQILLDKNDLDGAEEQILEYTKVAVVTSEWINPFEEKYINEVFEHKERMFNFPGELGKFLGGFDRGWLVGITAPFKRGKTFTLQEFAVSGIQQGLNVAFLSLEMHRKASNERLYKRLAGIGDSDGGDAVYPCFDCLANQDGSCNKAERTNSFILLNGDGDKPKFDSSLPYKPCIYCRENDPSEYMVAWWKEILNRPAYNQINITKQIMALRKKYKHKYKFIRYPRFSADIDDIKRDLDMLERSKDFIPDVIIIDYADILKTEKGVSDTTAIDVIWKELSRLAGERHALTVTAAQTTRGALDKKQVKQSDTSLWIGKLAHVDAMITLNQLDYEKKEGIMRVSKMAHRYDDFNEDSNCVILQKLGFGQVHLDSERL